VKRVDSQKSLKAPVRRVHYTVFSPMKSKRPRRTLEKMVSRDLMVNNIIKDLFKTNRMAFCNPSSQPHLVKYVFIVIYLIDS